MDDEPDLAVIVTAAAGDAELAADRLWQAGATAVAEEDEGPGLVRLTASFPTRDATRLVAGEVGGRVAELDPSWRTAWQATAQAVEVGSLVVAPAWRNVPVGEGRLVLRIDSGAVFGSGTHATTRMLLAALDATPPLGLEVLDVGCGSGILSVAAARLGARSVTAIDIDPACVDTTVANAEANGVTGGVRASCTPIAAVDGSFDLALVNVTAGVHAEIGPEVVARVRPGGRILLSGLLAGQWRHVAPAYTGGEELELLALDGWHGALLSAAGARS